MTDLSMKSMNHDHESQSPDQSPHHSWPMVPVLQTLTVLSDGEEELMEQKMGIENGYINVPKLAQLDPALFNLSPMLNGSQTGNGGGAAKTNGSTVTQKRKVGRPITSVKTMNRTFPAVEEIRAKLEANECYVRPRASSSSSDVWALFQEVAYRDTHFFTGIVQCKSCKFLTRYHGQITGTSHMRRHHCFSVLFPNSTPANRRTKTTNQTANGDVMQNALKMNVDADSTTPRMLKKLKKEISQRDRALKQQNNAEQQQQAAFNFLSQLPVHMNGTNLSMHSSNSHHNNSSSHVTIHPALPKKKFRNGHYTPPERSLIASSSAPSYSIPVNSSMLPNSNGSSHSSQSMLHSVVSAANASAAANSSSHSSSPDHHHSSPSSSPNLIVPSNVTNNLRIQNSKQDLRERLVQFCCQELVPLKSVNSESFRSILQSHLRLCTTQLHHQLLQQQQQHPQLVSLTSMISSFMNHLSHQMPDLDQLRTNLELLYGQCRDKIRQDLNLTLETNVGGALICDSEQDTCIISVYYVDSDWRLVEAILSTSAMVYDINQFVSRTLETYSLQDRKKLSKFTFVSHGGLFDGVSVCLSSMAHIVDKVVEEAFTLTDDSTSSSKSPSQLADLFENCQELASRFSITVDPLPYEVDWICKYELMKALLNERDHITASEEKCPVNFELISQLVELLEPFQTASHELRQCFKHPTLSHVLLYFHKLKKVLSSSSSSPSSASSLLMTNRSAAAIHRATKVNFPKVPQLQQKEAKKPPVKVRSDSSDTNNNNNNSGVESNGESDSDEEKETDSHRTKKGSNGINGKVHSDSKKKLIKGEEEEENNDDEDEDEDEEDDEDEEETLDQTLNLSLIIASLKQFLTENLKRHYEVQSLHRIATFLWPNFRFLKMLTAAEQKEVHDDVRKLLVSRVTSASLVKSGHQNGVNGSGGSNGNSHDAVNGHDSNGGSLLAKSKSRSDFDEWEVLSDQDQDEVDKYLSVQLTSCSEHYVLQWWREHSNEFPKLSQLAKWILAIPASVTTRERFQISNNRHVDDLLLFLHCNMQTDKFDLTTLRKAQTKSKVKHSKNSSVPSSSSTSSSTSLSSNSASLIAQSNC